MCADLLAACKMNYCKMRVIDGKSIFDVTNENPEGLLRYTPLYASIIFAILNRVSLPISINRRGKRSSLPFAFPSLPVQYNNSTVEKAFAFWNYKKRSTIIFSLESFTPKTLFAAFIPSQNAT